MKKSYLILAGLAATFSSYAQGNLTNYTEAINKGLVTVEKPGTNQILNELKTIY